MANWLALAPAGGPRPVEEARAAAQALADAAPQDRQALADAKATLVEAETKDREALAEQMRRGHEPVSDVKRIDEARQAIGTAERHLQGRLLAVEDAQQEFRGSIEQTRDEWLATSQRAAEKAAVRASKTLSQLTSDLTTLRQAQATASWLAPGGGFDRQQQVSPPVLGTAASSGFQAANGAPVSGDVLLGWVGELIDPPQAERPTAPAERVPAEA